MTCDIYDNNDKYSYYTSLCKSLTNNKNDTDINNFFSKLSIHIVPDSNVNSTSIKRVNKNISYSTEQNNIKGMNTIILEKNNEDQVYISGYGKKDKIVKSKPTVIFYKTNGKYFPVYKKKENKNVYLFKTTGSMLNKLIKKYDI